MSAPRVGLLEAVADRRLLPLAPHPRQAELLAAVERSRLVVAACGRRFGKTRAAAAAALYNLLLVPELDRLVSKGERRYAVSVGNNQAQARLFVEHAASIVKGSTVLRRELVSESANELVFSGNRVLAGFPCTAKGGRGWPVSFLCLDEFAHHFDIEEGGPAVASRIWAAMTPSVAQFGEHGRIVVISTPLGSDGLFAELHAKAGNGEIPAAESFHGVSADNPLVDAAYLSAQEVALGHDDFRREFLAEFIAGGASFLEHSRVRDVVGDFRELLPTDAEGWVCALDPAFASDPTAVAVVGRHPFDRERLLVGHVQRWLPPKRKRGRYRTPAEAEHILSGILDEVAAVAARFQARVVSDQHLPGTIGHELGKRGVAVSVRPWTAASKTEAFTTLRARIYTQRLELPDDPQLVAELCRLRTKYRAGAATVEVPKVGDSHCDIAVALALGVAELDRSALGGTVGRRREPSPEAAAVTVGLADAGPGFVRGDPTRKPKWYDRGGDDSSIADRIF